MLRAGDTLVVTFVLLVCTYSSTAELQYPKRIVNQEINATANRTQLTNLICDFNKICMRAENTTLQNREEDDAEADDTDGENGNSRRKNSTGYYFVARVSQIKADADPNTTSIVSNLNLTCRSMPNTSIIILAGSLNISTESLINRVISNISCQEVDAINTTDFQDTGKAEAKPFLKVLYISTQLFVYMLVSACFGVFAQLKTKRAQLLIGALPRAQGTWVHRGWFDKSSKGNIIGKIFKESQRAGRHDKLLRGKLFSKRQHSIERLGWSTQEFSFRKRVINSSNKLERISHRLMKPRKGNETLRNYLLRAVNTLEKDNKDDEYALFNQKHSSLRVHVNAYLRHWERAAYGNSELSKTDWETFRQIYDELCSRLKASIHEFLYSD